MKRDALAGALALVQPSFFESFSLVLICGLQIASGLPTEPNGDMCPTAARYPTGVLAALGSAARPNGVTLAAACAWAARRRHERPAALPAHRLPAQE